MPDKKTPTRLTCGIVMPIAAMGEQYPEEHWMRVQKILRRAVENAGLEPKLVWENPSIDIIQTAILQNLYQNDVVICDLSNLNPNVMLEAGLRLSTKKPTIIVTDKIKKPPFDVSNFGYIDYPKDLEYNAIDIFIERLSKKISDVVEAQSKGEYKSFVENFQFETVDPATKSVSESEFILERLNELALVVRRLDVRQRRSNRPETMNDEISSAEMIGEFSFHVDEEIAKRIEDEIDRQEFVYCLRDEASDGIWRFKIYKMAECTIPSELVISRSRRRAREVLTGSK